MKISAVVPVYNNEKTIERVADVLRYHPKITEVILVNDASRDRSADILRSIPGIVVVTHRKNKGKGAGIVAGWKAATHETLLTVDADLARITTQHLDDMIEAYETDEWDMVIGAHEPRSLFDWVSGQRIYRKSAVMPYASLAAKVGNGIEQVVNHAHRSKRITMVYTKNIGHILKYQRHYPHQAAWLYMKEGWQLARTEYLLRFRNPVV